MDNNKFSWIERAVEHLQSCLGMESLGGVSWRFVEEEGLLIVAPSLLEMIGGRNDREEVYTFFGLDIGELAGVFDAPPVIYWSTREQMVSLEGRIGGEDTWLQIRSLPFDDEEPSFNLYSDGSLGER